MKFNFEGLLRGKYKSRMDGYTVVRQNGWMSANDIRELENLDRISEQAGWDLYLVNGNMLPLGLAGAYASTQPAESEQIELESESVEEPSSNELPLRRRVRDVLGLAHT